MPKRKLSPYEDWEAPWEKDGGEFDADVARRLIYRLTKNNIEYQNRNETLRNENEDLTEAAQEAAGEGESGSEGGGKDAEKETGKMDSLLEAKYQAALKHGLDVSDVHRLVGKDAAEIEKDAESLSKRLNPQKSDEEDPEEGSEEGEEGEEEEAEMPTRRPSTPRTDLGRKSGGPTVLDPAKEAEKHFPRSW